MNVRQVKIGGHTVGIIGLDEIFNEVKTSGETDEARLKQMLLEKVKAKNYIPPRLEETYKQDLFDEFLVWSGKKKERARNPGVLEIRVYGAGCPRCQMLDRMVMEVISEKGLEADYQYVTDPREIAAAGILGSPALAVNGKIVAVGNVPSRKELEKLFMQTKEKPP